MRIRLIVIAALAAATAHAAPPAPTVDQSVAVGKVRWRTTLHERDQKLVVEQKLHTSFDGSSFRFETKTTYAGSPPRLAMATASVFRDGKLAMSGSVRARPGGKGLEWSAVSGEGDARRAKGTKASGALPGGPIPLLLQPVVPILAPRFLPQAGEIAVVYVEFPDDWHVPELVEPKEKHKLVRTPVGREGGFRITLFDGRRGRARMTMTYDAKGRCVAIAFGGRMPLPVKHAR